MVKGARIEMMSFFCICQHLEVNPKKLILYSNVKKENELVCTGSPLSCYLIIFRRRECNSRKISACTALELIPLFKCKLSCKLSFSILLYALHL